MAARESSRSRSTAILATLFAVYLALLVWVVLWKLHLPFIGRDDMREIKLVPFASTVGFGANAPVEIVGNLLLFIPFGVYLRLLAPAWSVWKVVAVIVGASVILEVAQYLTAVGSSDVTDVIVNTAGGLIGIALLALVRRRFLSTTAVVMTWILAVTTVLALVAVGAIVASFPHIPPPHGGVVTIVN